MKRPYKIPRFYRIVVHFFLVAEQLLGPRLFRVTLNPIKNFVIARMTRLWSNRPRLPELQVDRVESLSTRQFQNGYFAASKPVIFDGAATNWPCCKKWDLDYFSVAHGNQDLLIVQSEGLTTRERSSEHQFLSVRDLIGNIRQGGDRYLRFSPLLHDNPELADDLDLNWLGQMRGPGTFGNTYYMFMGGRGQKTYLHADQPCNLYVQIHGEKKWTLFYPEDSVGLYPQVTNSAYVRSPVDLDNPDLKKFPLLGSARAYTAHLRPGDVLYVPPHVWHQVENLSDSIAVGYRFSSVKAALKSSIAFSLIRILSSNPPVWKTRQYGRIDTNLIWAAAAGKIDQVMRERELRRTNNDQARAGISP